MTNLLANSRVYLAGAVEHAGSGAKSWRATITERLTKYNVHVYDPLVKPQWLHDLCKVDPSLYRKVLSGSSDEMSCADVLYANRELRRLCLKMVSTADWIICYLPITFTAGTFEEIYLAAQLDKPVLFCIPDGIPSTWILPVFSDAQSLNTTFFKTWDALLEHVDNIDAGHADIDKIKWLAATYKRSEVVIQ